LPELRFAPFEHGVALHAAELRARLLRNSGFLLKTGNEPLGIGQPFPDLRQVGRVLALFFVAVFENDAVDSRAEPGDQFGVVREPQPLGRREQRHFDVGARELFERQRLETRVLERRGAGVRGDVLGERPLRIERTDATAQLITLHKRDEA